jgi:hypothetical protein
MRLATSIARFRTHFFDDHASLGTTLAAARPYPPRIPVNKNTR